MNVLRKNKLFSFSLNLRWTEHRDVRSEDSVEETNQTNLDQKN